MTRGLTLLETLAAVTLLGLVATAVVPMTMQLGTGELGLDERLAARRWLLGQSDPGIAAIDLVQPIKGHPGWFLHRRSFLQTSGKRVDTPIAPPDHSFVHLLVCRGVERDAEVLADRIVVVMDDDLHGAE